MKRKPAYFASQVERHLTARGVTPTILSADDCKIEVDGKTFEPLDDESAARMAGRIYLATETGAEKLRAIASWIDEHRENFNDRFTLEQLVKLWEHAQLHEDRLPQYADTWTEEQITEALGAGSKAEVMSEKTHEPTPFSVYCQARAVVSMGREYPTSMCNNDPRLLFAAMVGVEDAQRFKQKETAYPSETQILTKLAEVFDRRVGLGTLERRVEVALGIDCRDGIVQEARIVDVIIGGQFRPTRAAWQKLIEAGLPMCSWQEASESWDQQGAIPAMGLTSEEAEADRALCAMLEIDPSAELTS